MAVIYSIPSEAKKLLREGILANPLIQKNLPAGASEAAEKVSFVGSNSPSLPVNWRFAESISALKGYEAAILNVLLKKKDHAQLFIMSAFLWVLDPAGLELSATSVLQDSGRAELAKYFPSWDKYDSMGSWYRIAATNIYKTKDGKFFHLHGSMNPDPTLKFIGLPLNMDFPTPEEANAYVQDAVAKHTAEELQALADEHKQAGTICWTKEEFKASEHGKANAEAGLFEIEAVANPNQKPGWWTPDPRTSAARPLAGLKVVDLTRVIAGPTITRSLAELGASVMRITAPHLPDMSMLHPDLNHGKWNACLDLRDEADRHKLRDLVLGADVFVQGYRPGVLDKYGFGEDDVIRMCEARGRGIVYCAENCYG
ncbi:c497e181-ad63-42c7-a5f5-b004b152f1ed [Thermothielavioides terrestris]|uniref:C497e181-ad63-42c7-a5f5-b004b152f1ed n=1 Tax=Thermothielavioides terrestris TaxID=2587410 RepID=A0A446BC08_9PEZI|nr:c497e181-ad63-42c7-a5f5-b004b152f1ed [Thermothielavioides terrestris]